MKTASTIVATVSLLVVIIGASLAQSCETDDDCSFLGTCNKVTKICVCNIDCRPYSPAEKQIATYYCMSHRRWPASQCKALTHACERQENLKLKIYEKSVFLQHTSDCRQIPYVESEVFCEDQSFCQGNGICFKTISGDVENKFCRCNRYYSGERCAARLLGVAGGFPTDQSGDGPMIVDGTQSNQLGGGQRGVLGQVAPYLALGLFSVMLGCCFAAQYVKRRNDKSLETNQQAADGSSDLNQVIVAGKDQKQEEQVLRNHTDSSSSLSSKSTASGDQERVAMVVEYKVHSGKRQSRARL